MRRALPRLLVVALVLATAVFLTAARASAQQPIMAALAADAAIVPPGALTNGVLFPAAPVANATQVPAIPVSSSIGGGDFEMRRPPLLPALYATTIALQALDAHSTMTALGQGAREANPLMQGVVKHSGALLAVKAGVAASTIFLAEKMWKRNRVGAIVMMAVVNAIDAAVVMHNYSVASRLR